MDNYIWQIYSTVLFLSQGSVFRLILKFGIEVFTDPQIF